MLRSLFSRASAISQTRSLAVYRASRPLVAPQRPINATFQRFYSDQAPLKTLYIGNIPFNTTAEEIGELVSPYGKISAVRLIFDRYTGRSRGFGYVELDAESAEKALQELNGRPFMGRDLRVNEASPPVSRNDYQQRRDRMPSDQGGYQPGGYQQGGYQQGGFQQGGYQQGRYQQGAYRQNAHQGSYESRRNDTENFAGQKSQAEQPAFEAEPKETTNKDSY